MSLLTTWLNSPTSYPLSSSPRATPSLCHDPLAMAQQKESNTNKEGEDRTNVLVNRYYN